MYVSAREKRFRFVMVNLPEKKGQRILLCSLHVLCLVGSSLVHAQCAKFQFPTGNINETTGHPVVAVPENQSVAIPFLLNTQNCSNREQETSISVARRDKDSSTFIDVCRANVRDNKVVGGTFGGGNCQIESGRSKGSYSFKTRLNRSDGTWWRWRASYDGLTSRKVRVDVTYPPRILRFAPKISTTVLEQGSPVDLVCSYEKGNPDVAPFLVDEGGEKLREVVPLSSSGEVRHTIRDVSCNDTGTYGCRAYGAARNMSMTLLVKCPPRFRKEAGTRKHFVVDAGKPPPLPFQLRSHTTKVSECRLARWRSETGRGPADSEERTRNCLSYIRVFGQPPDLTLSLTFPNLTSSNLDTWQLAVSNDAGSDDVSFGIEFLVVYEPSDDEKKSDEDDHHDASGEEENADEDEGGSEAGVIIAAVVVVVIVGAVLGIVVFFLTRRYRGRSGLPWRICARRDVTAQPQHPPEGQDYSVPELRGGESESRAANRGELAGSHLYSPMSRSSLQLGHVYETPKEPFTTFKLCPTSSHDAAQADVTSTQAAV